MSKMRLTDIGRLGGDINNETAYVYMNPELELMLPSFLSRGYVDVEEVRYYKTSNSGNALIRGYDIGTEGLLRPEVSLELVHNTYKNLFTTHGITDVGLTDPTYTWYNPWTSQTMSNTTLEIYKTLMREDPLRFTLIFLARYARRRRAVTSIPTSFNVKALASVSNVRSNTRYVNGGYGSELKWRLNPKHSENNVYGRTVDAVASLASVSDLDAYLYEAENRLMNTVSTQAALSSISGTATYNAIVAKVHSNYYRPYTSYVYPSVEFRDTLTCESGTTTLSGNLNVTDVTFAPGLVSTPLTYGNLRIFSNLTLHKSVSATSGTSISGNLTIPNNGTISSVNTSNLVLQGPLVAQSCAASAITYNGTPCTASFSNLTLNSGVSASNLTIGGTMSTTSASGIDATIMSNLTSTNISSVSCLVGGAMSTSGILCTKNNLMISRSGFGNDLTQSSIMSGLVKFVSGTPSTTWNLPSLITDLPPSRSIEFDIINDSGVSQTVIYTNFRLVLETGSYRSIIASKNSGDQMLYASPHEFFTNTPQPSNPTFENVSANNITPNTLIASNVTTTSVSGVIICNNIVGAGTSITTQTVSSFTQTPPTLETPKVSFTITPVEYSSLTMTLNEYYFINNITTFIGNADATWTLPNTITGMIDGKSFKTYIRNKSSGFILTINSSAGITWKGVPYICIDTTLPIIVSMSNGVISAYPIHECL